MQQPIIEHVWIKWLVEAIYSSSTDKEGNGTCVMERCVVRVMCVICVTACVVHRVLWSTVRPRPLSNVVCCHVCVMCDSMCGAQSTLEHSEAQVFELRGALAALRAQHESLTAQHEALTAAHEGLKADLDIERSVAQG
jgi:hypothetical protein